MSQSEYFKCIAMKPSRVFDELGVGGFGVVVGVGAGVRGRVYGLVFGVGVRVGVRIGVRVRVWVWVRVRDSKS